ncbi:hypothetical protein JOB18_020280 [Solea senegalensis]|uniref:Uncharacterized protein n=1 Tax=Solea senegalensis TaxID=28829 RepID=A0AAV6Q693_SOLSE|nr:hypothetical protein JOB18_020280 [Solea senegalensis]
MWAELDVAAVTTCRSQPQRQRSGQHHTRCTEKERNIEMWEMETSLHVLSRD